MHLEDLTLPSESLPEPFQTSKEEEQPAPAAADKKLSRRRPKVPEPVGSTDEDETFFEFEPRVMPKKPGKPRQTSQTKKKKKTNTPKKTKATKKKKKAPKKKQAASTKKKRPQKVKRDGQRLRKAVRTLQHLPGLVQSLLKRA